jgi:hypothetical protein
VLSVFVRREEDGVAERVVKKTPAVTRRTAETCVALYLIPCSIEWGRGKIGITHRLPRINQPRHMLTIKPPLLKMICTLIGMSYPNAILFNNERK